MGDWVAIPIFIVIAATLAAECYMAYLLWQECKMYKRADNQAGMVLLKKKGFFDWLWNFQIRARTSRRREGCSYKQYKQWDIEGYERTPEQYEHFLST